MPPAGEHFLALRESGYTGEVNVGLVGSEENREFAHGWLLEEWSAKWDMDIVVQADDGFEQVTIDVMHAAAKEADPQTPFFYAHAKGSFEDHPFNTAWRRSMTGKLLGGKNSTAWLSCVNLLHSHDDIDCVGCHWLSRPDAKPDFPIESPMFGGNFWWAKAGYLANLESVFANDPTHGYIRYFAESWVGRGKPKVIDLKPGWPVYETEPGYNSILGGRLHA